jgi:predicted ester cyclase
MSARSPAPRLARLAVAAMFLAVAAPGRAESPRDASRADLAANKQIMTRFLEEVWNGGHLELCDDLFAKDGIAHHRGHLLSAGPAAVKQVVSRWRDGLAGFHFTVHSLTAEDDLVVAYLTFTGKHVKPLLGIAPSGKDVKVEEVLLVRIAGGRIVELWELFDEYAFRREVGGLPAPQPPPAKP